MKDNASQGMKYFIALTLAAFLALMAVALFPTKMTPYRHYIANQYKAPGMVSPPHIENAYSTFFYESQKIVIINQGDELNPLVKAVPYQ
jgi:hypothetical protein